MRFTSLISVKTRCAAGVGLCVGRVLFSVSGRAEPVEGTEAPAAWLGDPLPAARTDDRQTDRHRRMLFVAGNRSSHAVLWGPSSLRAGRAGGFLWQRPRCRSDLIPRASLIQNS